MVRENLLIVNQLYDSTQLHNNQSFLVEENLVSTVEAEKTTPLPLENQEFI